MATVFPFLALFVACIVEHSASSSPLNFPDDESNYNKSNAFRSWLNRVLLNYDNRLRPYFGVRQLKIRLGLALIGISSISETDMSFSVEMFFHESWVDDRLSFQAGLFGTHYPITLPLNASYFLWTPDTSFLNALDSKVPEVGSVSHLYSMMLYPNGTIGYSRRLSVTAQCLMDLTMYPFDRQACTLELSSYGWTNDDLVYEWIRKDASIKGLSLADFDAQSSLLKVINRTYSAGNFSVPTFCVVLTRRSGFCFLQLFVPATAVVISSWISLWLDNETQFTDIVSVILAIIFLSYSYNTVMPKVSYVKAMDIYLLACFIFVFSSLVKLAIVKYMRAVVHKRKEKRAVAAATIPHVASAPDALQTSESEGDHVLEPSTETALSPESAESKLKEITEDSLEKGMPQVRKESDVKPPQKFQHATKHEREMQLDEKKRRSSRAAVRRRAQRQSWRLAFQYPWAAMGFGIHLPSLHDNYWKCMKAFHLGSQLVLPIAFGAFAVFYFFIFPHVRTNQGECM